MDYEKKYKEALEWARKVMQGKVGFVLDEVLEKFPELKESGDERIRKEMISYFKQINYDNAHTWDGINLNVFLAWLEKRGENNMGISESVKQKLEDNLNKALETETPESWNKFLDEQKSADKVESKFKVDDWIINTITNEIEQIIELTDYEYICSGHLIISFNNQHLLKRWTIEDAKDGDVLVCGERKRPFIFKGLIDKSHPESPVAYCGIDTLDNFIIAIGRSWWTDEEVYPATKEQHKLLFQRMEEAGWEWDAYKKELKLIEPFN